MARMDSVVTLSRHEKITPEDQSLSGRPVYLVGVKGPFNGDFMGLPTQAYVFELAYTEDAPDEQRRDMFLSRNTVRDDIAKWLTTHPGQNIGPCLLVKPGKAWIFQDIGESEVSELQGSLDEIPF